MRPASLLAVLLCACGSSSGETPEPRLPDVSRATFPATPAIGHPDLPMPVGASWTYRTPTEDTQVTVTPITQVIHGVTAVEVHDQVTKAGVVTEDTLDFFAQDDAGNVWYLGEDTCTFENGTCTDREGSW